MRLTEKHPGPAVGVTIAPGTGLPVRGSSASETQDIKFGWRATIPGVRRKWKGAIAGGSIAFGAWQGLLQFLDWIGRGDSLNNFVQHFPEWVRFVEHPLVAPLCLITGCAWLTYVTRERVPAVLLFNKDGQDIYSAERVGLPKTAWFTAALSLIFAVVFAIPVYVFYRRPVQLLIVPSGFERKVNQDPGTVVPGVILVGIRVNNFGDSPALHVGRWSCVTYEDHVLLSAELNSLFVNGRDQCTSYRRKTSLPETSIGPKSSADFLAVRETFTPEQVAEFRAHVRDPNLLLTYILGAVKYTDGLRSHETPICFVGDVRYNGFGNCSSDLNFKAY